MGIADVHCATEVHIRWAEAAKGRSRVGLGEQDDVAVSGVLPHESFSGILILGFDCRQNRLVLFNEDCFLLLLGALGLVNIAMVTVMQRIREISIRRSFEATAGRVFFAVTLESVVATIAAGIVPALVAVRVWVIDAIRYSVRPAL